MRGMFEDLPQSTDPAISLGISFCLDAFGIPGRVGKEKTAGKRKERPILWA